MNTSLSVTEIDAILEILERGLVRIRLAAMDRDIERAEAIADALHNLPRLVREGDRWGWTIAEFRALFLTPLVQRYPDLCGLEQPFESQAR